MAADRAHSALLAAILGALLCKVALLQNCRWNYLHLLEHLRQQLGWGGYNMGGAKMGLGGGCEGMCWILPPSLQPLCSLNLYQLFCWLRSKETHCKSGSLCKGQGVEIPFLCWTVLVTHPHWIYFWHNRTSGGGGRIRLGSGFQNCIIS